MPKKYFSLIIIVLGVVLLGIFVAWLLVNRGYIELSPSDSTTGQSDQPESVFPLGNPDPGNNSTNNSPFGDDATNTSEIILQSGNETGGSLSKLATGAIGQLLATGSGTSTILFFERATGHLFQLLPGSSAFRVSNTTLPKVIRAWGGVASSTTNFVIRTNNGVVQTKLASLPNSSASSSTSIFLGTEAEVGNTPQSLAIQNAPTNAVDFAISPSGNRLAYAQLSGQGINLIVTDWNNLKSETVASLPFTQVDIAWPASTTIALETKAAYNAGGVLYFYDLNQKKLSRIIGGISGLDTKVSPDARFVLYSGSSGRSLAAALIDRSTGKINRLPFKTLADKCVWSSASDKIYCGAPEIVPENNYPDAWNQGLVSFEDNLWELEINSRQATRLFSPELNGLDETIDVTQLALDEQNSRLYFVNKNDFSLWSLSLGMGF